MKIQTPRFSLRDFVDSDALEFERYHLDARFLEHRRGEESRPGHARELVQLFQQWAQESPRRNFQLAITRRSSDTIIGCVGLRCADAQVGTAEFGMDLAPEYWGKFGYAAEALASLLTFGFESLTLEMIYGKTVSANSRIGKLAQAIGARAIEHDSPSWMLAKGWRQLEWRLTREAWKSSALASRWS